ncbi:MAG: hypothetical protein PHU85_01955 [Phycisphaerae bacterium]|nr:hypothetical protein [Phycisphaerae bacterium]
MIPKYPVSPEAAAEINRLEGERDHYRRRAEQLSESLDTSLEIRAAACEWYAAWKGKSITAMKDANLRLRDAVEKWLAFVAEPTKE